MQYSIKQFEALTNSELYQLLKLRQAVFIIEQSCIYPDIDDRDQAAHHLIAFDGGELVGCLRILARGVAFEEASIGRVVVSANNRRRGVAEEMLRQALAFIRRELKEKHVKISAQTQALPLYENLGFKTVGAEYLEDDIPHVDMLCTLAEGV
ncbi:MAG: GNAT family N-acetyltransferase [Oscillospiraceae bacterium]|nr:GNAT family N-acetyltransferase [Oscillospiraceae bacterium]